MCEDDNTVVVWITNWKGFKRDWLISSATMNLWIATARSEFLKGKLGCKKKNKEPLAELRSQISRVLQHQAAKVEGDCIIVFCPIEKHKLLRFVDKDGAKGSNR
jgi:hypothetical protein